MVAAWYLRFKGYRILSRRHKTPAGEIYLIARRGRTIVFVEVKQRPDDAAVLDAVTATARKRIARAADLWLSRHPAAVGFDRRFDIILALPRSIPRHLTSVFDDAGRFW